MGIALAATGAHGSAAGQVRVSVSVRPQKYFVQQILKDRVAVEAMALPGASHYIY
jgi:ABC-type Zn uptake system ZnuABC Zn-binding protein ZnuA